jgi:hypothetical protein
MTNLLSPTPTHETIVIRPAESVEDNVSVRLLAQLDSTRLAAGPALIAEVDGETRAALSLSDGRVVADPFHPTADVAALLRVHAESTNGDRPGPLARLAARLLPERSTTDALPAGC